MVSATFGVIVAESELRGLCDCAPRGTDALKAVDAARKLGLTGTGEYTLSLEELHTLVADGHHPIVFVDLRPIDGITDIHALVAIATSQQDVIVLDPLKGGTLTATPGVQCSLGNAAQSRDHCWDLSGSHSTRVIGAALLSPAGEIVLLTLRKRLSMIN